MKSELLKLSDKLKELKDIKSDLDLQIKDINDEMEKIQADMIDTMTRDEISSFSHNDTTFSLVTLEFYAPEQETKAALWKVMRKQGFEDLFTINSKTLQSVLKEIVENNDEQIPSWLRNLIKKNEKTSIRMSRKKS